MAERCRTLAQKHTYVNPLSPYYRPRERVGLTLSGMRLFIALLLLLLRSAPGQSQPPLSPKEQRQLAEVKRLRNQVVHGDEIVQLCMALATSHHPDVQTEVGEALANGMWIPTKKILDTQYRDGVLHQKKLGYQLLAKAAAQGSLKAQALLIDTLQRADQKRPLLLELAQLGCGEAQFRLWRLEHLDVRSDKDHARAFQWLLAAAQNNNPDAQISLAVAYRSGKQIAQNLDSALALYERAAAQYNLMARQYLIDLYSDETLPTYDLVRALAWSERDSREGNHMPRYLGEQILPRQSKLCQRLGRLEQALACLKQIEVINKKYPFLGQKEGELFFQRGKLYLQLGKKKKALYWLEYATHFGLSEPKAFYEQLRNQGALSP